MVMQKNRTLLKAMTLLWMGILVAGFGGLNYYSFRAGSAVREGTSWPKNSQLNFKSGKNHILLFMHPRCTCSLATLNELDRILSGSPQNWHLDLVFFQPEHASKDWYESRLWQKAQSFHQARVHVDRAGHLAQAFGAQTSGTLMLFDQEKNLLFKGGITTSRGHEGETDAGRALRSYLRQSIPLAQMQTPVFGCSLGSVQ